MQLKQAPVGAKVIISNGGIETVVIVDRNCGDPNCCLAVKTATFDLLTRWLPVITKCRPAWNRIR
jgi:hypothetical protein